MNPPNITKRLSRDTNYKPTGTTYTQQLSEAEIKKKLEDYVRVKKEDVPSIPLNTHIRYFSINPKTGEKQFRMGGMLTKHDPNNQYIVCSNGTLSWSVQIANSVFDLVNMFAKKGSKLAKGVAVAQATMNTYQGVTAALAAPSTVPEPFGTALKIANSVVIGATGFMNVKKILSTNEQGGGSAGGGSSAPQTPSAPSFNLVQGTGSNQIATSISKQAPFEAYVVSKNVTTAAELDRNIVKGASL
jgi:hypothetical protein